MDTFEVLCRAGLGKREALVLETLLEHGDLTLTEIHRHTAINRPALYLLLPAMCRGGLIHKTPHGQRMRYRADSLRHLLSRFEEDAHHVREQLRTLDAAQRMQSKEKPCITYREGERGVTAVYDDIVRTLPENSVFYRYTSRTGDTTAFSNTQYARLRDEKGIERMVITSERKASEKSKKLERSLKTIPKSFDLFEDNVSLIIYGNKTAYVDYGSHTSFVVESEKIARFQEKLFRLLYKLL